jgi:hypothetical protein
MLSEYSLFRFLLVKLTTAMGHTVDYAFERLPYASLPAIQRLKVRRHHRAIDVLLPHKQGSFWECDVIFLWRWRLMISMRA